MALQRGVGGAGINASDLNGRRRNRRLHDSNGSNLPYLTDAWSRPVYLLRESRPDVPPDCNPISAARSSVHNDPGDPQGYLQNARMGAHRVNGPLYRRIDVETLTNSWQYNRSTIKRRWSRRAAHGTKLVPHNLARESDAFTPLHSRPATFNLSTNTFIAGTTGTGVMYSNP